MTLELLHGIRDYTLTRTSIPNHAGNIKETLCIMTNSICYYPQNNHRSINTETATYSIRLVYMQN